MKDQENINMEHLNFLEIGTSSFDTLINSSAEGVVGLSVEPVKEHFDKLVETENKKKVQLLISSKCGSDLIYFVSQENIKKYNLPFWVNGCNSIHYPHPTVVKLLKDRGITDNIIETDEIECITLLGLLERFDVKIIDYLKIDTEGHDLQIIQTFLDDVEPGDSRLPKRLMFESNSLVSRMNLSVTIARLFTFGYIIQYSGEDTVMTL